MGKPDVIHVDYSGRRAEWITTWPGLPGFMRADGSSGRRYTHVALPGWEYQRREIVSEMILDLEDLAERGERPTMPTR